MNQRDRDVHVVPGCTGVIVDGFKIPPSGSNGVGIYFLTHFHSDHYSGLHNRWAWGRIYCTEITKALVVQQLGVNEDKISVITVNNKTTIPNNGWEVTPLDANHCPGAVMLLFAPPPGEKDSDQMILHTGDMRACDSFKSYPALKDVKISRLFLDTTYAHAKHRFLPQHESISLVEGTAKAFLEKHTDGLVFLSAYNIGKERVFCNLIDKLEGDVKVYVDERKLNMLKLLGPEYVDRIDKGQFTTDPKAAQIHIVKMGFGGQLWPYFQPDFDGPREYMNNLGYSRDSNALVFIPSGWATSSNYNKNHQVVENGNICLQLVPYSEHSNFEELNEFVKWLRPQNVTPTVYKDEADKRNIVKRFSHLTNHTAAKQSFLALFGPKRKRGLPPQTNDPVQQPKTVCIDLSVDSDPDDSAGNEKKRRAP